MAALPKQYKRIAQETKAYHEKIMDILKTNKIVADLYKGSQVLFSPYKKYPEILLLGINPGPGYYNENNCCVDKFNPLKKLEYLEYDYKLAVDTKFAFERAGLSNILMAKTVKSNIYYTATKNTNSLWSLNHALRSENINDPEITAFEWTRQLVEIVKPKIIVCEGATVFKEFCKVMTGVKKDFKGETVTKRKINNYNVIAYSRKINSGIADIESLVELLKNTFT